MYLHFMCDFLTLESYLYNLISVLKLTLHGDFLESEKIPSCVDIDDTELLFPELLLFSNVELIY